MYTKRLKFRTHLFRWLAVAAIGALLVCAGCSPEANDILRRFNDTLPQLREHSIQPPEPTSNTMTAFTALIDTNGRENPEFFIDVLGQDGQGGLRLDADCQRAGDVWNCDARQTLSAGTYRVQWIVFFDFQGGMVNGTRTFMTFPTPAVPLTVLYAPGGGGGVISPGSTDGCDDPAPTIAPAIEGPLDGMTCVGQPGGNRALVQFRFREVAAACGSGAYQIEIHRLDAECTPVLWDGTGSGFNDLGTCWIADLNIHDHSDALDQATQYRWRVRANSTSDTDGVGPFSEFQAFTTGSPPDEPVFVFPLDGNPIQMGTATGSSISVTWETQCGGELFEMTVFDDDHATATITGSGNTTMVPVRRGHAYRLELKVTSIWGASPQAQLRFSTTQ